MRALALIIGNTQYSDEGMCLTNAVNDANDLSEKLVSLGFVIIKETDCSNEMMDLKLKEFHTRLADFDVGLFYFAGHGMEVEGKNYLANIDTRFTTISSVKYSSIGLDEIIEQMQLDNLKTKILIIDACRDNPLQKEFRSVLSGDLAAIKAPRGTIIAFSTSPGKKALDFGMGRNSVYTGSILNHIGDSGVQIEEFFKRVRNSVYSISLGRQTTWEHTSLISSFSFNSNDLIQVVDNVYDEEYIADSRIVLQNSEIEKIILELKSYNYYIQKPAVNKLKSIKIDFIDKNILFLLGRNILQTAVGGEYTAITLIKNLENWLIKFESKKCEHILNGILFEIYFNSKGHFRRGDFKSNFIDEIFALRNNTTFNSSFDFVEKQLIPFREFVFYIPNIPVKTLPIEILFQKFEYYYTSSQKTEGLKLVSIRMEEKEILRQIEGDDEIIIIYYKDFLEKIGREMCLPLNLLKISSNFTLNYNDKLYIPWRMELSISN